MPAEHDHRAEPKPSTPSAAAASALATIGDSAAPERAPFITAVEIENFKGIGGPVRIDLRPITLLFGRNSAGKSTVLHALCYAHEVLSHRSVDARKTELGGDQVDLGGFHNFVHGHDGDRTIRLRFELNLQGWCVPRALDEKIVSWFDETASGSANDWLFPDSSAQARCGWVELKVASRRDRPALASYEVGVDGAVVGRLHATDRAGIALEFNPAHPLLAGAFRPPRTFVATLDRLERETSPVYRDANAEPLREAAASQIKRLQRHRVAVYDLTTPLPYWQEILRSNHRELARGFDHVDELHFDALMSVLLVGIGHDLHSGLAGLRYIGPIRNLHPHRDLESRTPDTGRWADGSAAWTHLAGSPGLGLIDNVSAWLAREDRLDTGYALRARSILKIVEGEAQLISSMREYRQLRARFGNAEGAVDLNRWVRRQAESVVRSLDSAIHVVTANCRRIRERFAEVAGGDRANYFDVEVQEAMQGGELVDRYVQHLCHLGSVDTIEARINAPVDEIDTSATWVPEDHRRLAGIIARMEERNKHRDEIRQLKAEDDDVAARLAECEQQLAEFSGPAQCGLEAGEEEIVDKLREIRAALEGQKALLEKMRAIRRKQLDIFSCNDNAERIGERINVSGIDDLAARVGRAREDYRRVAELIIKMERRAFTSAEVDELAAVIGAGTPQRELQLVADATGLPLRTSDIGVGVSQILPVVVAALDPDRPGITAIEQPELHVHPRMQVELGDLFAQRLDQGGVFLIETHSEHLMLRLLRRIEETHSGELPDGKPPLKPDQVSVVFVEQIDGEVKATPLRIDETGEFKDRWPHGFFEERDEELF